jgi:BirA family biotin operon repressor/biotin-[acetyl-CoA-carboxylase] ligase
MTTQESLLRLLADGQLVSGEYLASQLSISRAAVWKHVQQLSDLQISVHGRAGQGYQLDKPLVLFSQESIEAAMNEGARAAMQGLDVLWVADSTSQHLSKGHLASVPGFHACVAEYQTAGRGRRGRQWFAPFGDGICISVGTLFPVSLPNLACLGLAAGVGVLRALQRSGASQVQLKWPNDIVAGGRKLAGILIDVQGETDGPLKVVVGVGINYRMSNAVAKDITAAGGVEPVALQEMSEIDGLDRNVVTGHVIEGLYQVLKEFSELGFDAFFQEWNDADYLAGKEVTVVTDSGSVSGTASGIAMDGQLQIKTASGTQNFLSGDVSVRLAS